MTLPILVAAGGETVEVAQPTILLPQQLIEFSNFTTGGGGLSNQAGYTLSPTFHGNGIDVTTLRMRANTSTRASEVPAQSTEKPNPFYLVAVGPGGAASSPINTVDLADFTVDGTLPQGHLFGGLRIGYTGTLNIRDVKVTGCPGDASAPPGETFMLTTWHTNNSHFLRFILDGRDASGKPIAASPFGANSSGSMDFVDCQSHYAAAGIAFTHWDCYGTIYHLRTDARWSRRAFNFENTHDQSTIVLENCDLRFQTTTKPHVTLNTNYGSSKLTIIEPKVDSYPVKVGVIVDSTSLFHGKPQTQKWSDVKLIVDGKDVSRDSRYLIEGYSGRLPPA